MGGRNRIDFKGGLSKVGTEQEGWGIKTEENMGRDSWNWRTFWG